MASVKEYSIIATGIIVVALLLFSRTCTSDSGVLTNENRYDKVDRIAVLCKQVADSHPNLAVRAICHDIYQNSIRQKRDNAIMDITYLSMVLEDVYDESVDELRFYVDDFVSSTASV